MTEEKKSSGKYKYSEVSPSVSPWAVCPFGVFPEAVGRKML